jgi:hypothetical protein
LDRGVEVEGGDGQGKLGREGEVDWGGGEGREGGREGGEGEGEGEEEDVGSGGKLVGRALRQATWEKFFGWRRVSTGCLGAVAS